MMHAWLSLLNLMIHEHHPPLHTGRHMDHKSVLRSHRSLSGQPTLPCCLVTRTWQEVLSDQLLWKRLEPEGTWGRALDPGH